MKTAKTVFKICLVIISLFIILNVFPILSFRKFINKNPKSFSLAKGVFHIHSIFSDGKGDIEEITRAARESDTGIDFLILTDHGNPNLQSSRATSWVNDVLVIGGTEISLQEGHLAALGYEINPYRFPPSAQKALNDINRAGGVSFISHPYDSRVPWTDWSITGFTGMEILSLYTAARQKGLRLLFSFPVQYLFNRDFALLKLLKYPESNIQRWDQLNRSGRYFGIYSADAHAKLELSEKTTLNYPAYAALFRILSVYVDIPGRLDSDPRRAAESIIMGLRQGRFYNVIEALASAQGFEAFFVTADKRRVPMGSAFPLSEPGQLRIKLPFTFATNLKVLRDGSAVTTLKDNYKHDVEVTITEPGTYRIEVSISRSRFRKLPWILTNPFYLVDPETAGGMTPGSGKVYDDRKSDPLNLSGIVVETNPASEGRLLLQEEPQDGETLVFTYQLAKDPRKKDFWSALACREPFDFSGYRGFSLEARSTLPMRYWLEVRTGEGEKEQRFHCSFLATGQWQTMYLPFSDFIRVKGTAPGIDRTAVTSLFISVNSRISYHGISGQICLRNFRLVQ